ncbi:non-intrinsic ABC protein 12 [Prunus dulcis]|uniref:Non-intrinsic ABC protein 12 n=1 Tax=Prunus dulcis TaxID=3755 RepID=A0A5H2XQR4_PRUDU|nr:non-intrinsic ABC protein 12 [Prunus dulcis]
MDCSEKAPASAPNTGSYSEKAPCFSHPRRHHLRFKKASEGVDVSDVVSPSSSCDDSYSNTATR